VNIEPDNSPAAVEERKQKIKEAEDRKWTTLHALQILAYDGEEARPHKEYLLERLGSIMTGCDVCVRVFHQSRAEWRAQLMEYVGRRIGQLGPC
jgi:senataxin